MPQTPKKTPPALSFEIPIRSRMIALRKVRGLSQEALAEVMGISRKQVSDYELGRAHPNDEIIVRLALALGASADELLGLKNLDLPTESASLRFTRRMRELEKLPEIKIKSILKTIDDLIRANS